LKAARVALQAPLNVPPPPDLPEQMRLALREE
jgi:hypothetical protein